MAKPNDNNKRVPQFIRRLMPAAHEPELHEAADVFRQYMLIVLRIHQRIGREQQQSDSRDLEDRGRV